MRSFDSLFGPSTWLLCPHAPGEAAKGQGIPAIRSTIWTLAAALRTLPLGTGAWLAGSRAARRLRHARQVLSIASCGSHA